MAKSTDLSQQKLSHVFSTQDEMEARMVQELLHNARIECVINADVPPGLFPLKIGDLAQQDVFVLESQAQEAQRIIAEQHKSSE
ncbi:MAG: hypothetical protein A3G20_03160 [Acidobacteria bacterium RIFCSPLOWO2_12_FULL_59_11]|nr:MAG: hypothetical protein A3G20_03160 [Acidobacteria bacterium RIFCSPLOWO2_12_FULL_59_11]